MPPRARVAAESFSAAPGNMVNMDALVGWLEMNGFLRQREALAAQPINVVGGQMVLRAGGVPDLEVSRVAAARLPMSRCL